MLDDPFLDVIETGVIGVEHRTGLADVEAVIGTDSPGQLEHQVEPGPDPPVLRALLARALQLVDLSGDRGPRGVADRQRLQSGPVVVAVLAVTLLAELLADGRQLLAQQVLALGPLHALGDVGPDAILELQLGQRLASPRQDQLDPAGGIEGLEQLDLAFHRELGPVAGHVGQPAGLGDAAQDVAQASGAPVLGDGLEHGPKLASRLGRGLGGGRLLHDLHVDPQGRAGGRGGGADGGPLERLHDHGRGASRQGAAALDLGDRSHPGEPPGAGVGPVGPAQAGHENQAVPGPRSGLGGGARLRGLQGQGDGHARKHHPGIEGEQRQSGGCDR